MLVNESRSSRRLFHLFVSKSYPVKSKNQTEMKSELLKGITLYFRDGKFTVHTADYFKKVWIDKIQREAA